MFNRYARNITPDQISVEILRGKSELKNIELNEEVLTDVLELPGWLMIKKATCNRVQVRVPWTRLKSSPIQLVCLYASIHSFSIFISSLSTRSPSISN